MSLQTASHEPAQVVAARGQSWNSLTEDARQQLCTDVLGQRADPALLDELADMQRREPADFRLLGICAKALCDRGEYTRAFAAVFTSINSHCEQMLAGASDLPADRLEAFARNISTLLQFKEFVDTQNRKDTCPPPKSDANLGTSFERIFDRFHTALFGLSQEMQKQALLTLLNLAKCCDNVDKVMRVAELFDQSSAKTHLIAYTDFVRSLKSQTTYTRFSNRHASVVSQYERHLEREFPSERAFVKYFERISGARLDSLLDQTEDQAVEWLIEAAALLQKIGLIKYAGVIARWAEEVLERLNSPDLRIALALRLARFEDTTIRALAAKIVSECVSNATVKSNLITHIIKTSLLDADQLRSLHDRGLLNEHDLSPSHLSSFYATMGLFSEGIRRMRQAGRSAAAAFAETGKIEFFTTATGVTDRISEFEFLQQTSEILGSVRQPHNPRGLLVLVASGAHELNQFPLLAIKELKQRGYAVLPLVAGSLQYDPTGIPQIDDLANQLNISMNSARCAAETGHAPTSNWLSFPPFARASSRRSWVWAPERHEISYAGVNAYWGIREDIGCMERRYSVDFDSPRYTAYLADIRKRIEMWELLLERICAAGKATNLPVRIMLQYIHLSTHYYCRKYVEEASATQDISVIHTVIGYENYFANFAGEAASTIAVQDMTRNAELATGFFAPRDWFERHYRGTSESERDRIATSVEQVIVQSRIRRHSDASALKRLDFFKSERAEGRRIVSMIGKVLFDQEMPRGDGLVHTDMRDWFDHSVDIARRNPEMLLVIKPHPHELRDEIALYPTEMLRDWLPSPVPPNVHFLGNDELNLFELAETTDLALMWHGTSALELGVLGVPTILAAYYGNINTPVGHLTPTSRAHYEELMLRAPGGRPDPEIRRRCAVLIDYFRHSDISTPYRYTYRGFTNRYIRPHWIADDLAAYNSKGDKNVTAIADRIAGVAPMPTTALRDRHESMTVT